MDGRCAIRELGKQPSFASGSLRQASWEVTSGRALVSVRPKRRVSDIEMEERIRHVAFSGRGSWCPHSALTEWMSGIP